MDRVTPVCQCATPFLGCCDQPMDGEDLLCHGCREQNHLSSQAFDRRRALVPEE